MEVMGEASRQTMELPVDAAGRAKEFHWALIQQVHPEMTRQDFDASWSNYAVWLSHRRVH